ncbi:MAG: hypothetical protein KGJ13_08580 [Patescibacteria group bacterium]|nr:hypothetical protein [Patescibacteria group bacterium]
MSKRKQADPLKTIYMIQYGRVHFCYMVGLSFIQIWTDTKTDWPEMPEYFRTCFSIKTPFRHEYALENFVLKAIKKKVAEQRKAGTSAKPETLKEKVNRKKKTRQKEYLPFEG